MNKTFSIAAFVAMIAFIAFIAPAFSGCVTTTVNVTDRKPVARPFSRILIFYLDEGCDFSLFDSTLYNICLRTHAFADSGYAGRSDRESVIADKLSTPGTEILVASWYIDSAHSSYLSFRHYLDSMRVDGLLIVGARNYSHEEHTEQLPIAPSTTRNPVEVSVTHRYTSLNGTFMCDLFDTRSLVRPVWRAEIGEKGNRNSTKGGLTDKLMRQVAESLKNTQYIAH